MKPQIRGFVTRAAADLRPPRSISRHIAPAEGGVTWHYAGGPQRVSPLLSGHTRCVELWRMYQRVHMDDRGFVDVAYTGAVCQHGYAFAGRGSRIRTAANGTHDGNLLYYALVGILGEGEDPTDAMLDAFLWFTRELRRDGGAGDRVVPHSFHKPTRCPGRPLAAVTELVDRTPIPGEPPVTTAHDAQAVVAVTTVDLEAGRVLAHRWGLDLVLATGPTTFRSVLHGDARTVGYGFLVGKAADPDVVDRRVFDDGRFLIAGRDRNETAKMVGDLIAAFPSHEGDDRRGVPSWAA